MSKSLLVLLLLGWLGAQAHRYHPSFRQDASVDVERARPSPTEDQTPEKWNKMAKETIDKVLAKKMNRNLAKNAILFLGDGMGIPTITAGRMLKGQLKSKTGEEEITNMEKLDDLALSKTYNIDAQTPDSAGTATAFLTGVKTRIGAIGVDGRAIDCPTSLTSKLESILKWAQKAGKSTGIVTTTRVTHATPSSSYASIFDREMESFDGKNFRQEHYDQGCRDIAYQLYEQAEKINVVFAGGLRKFLNQTLGGDRVDGLNLIEMWEKKMQDAKRDHTFFQTYKEFNNTVLVDKKYATNNYHILGLMNKDHLKYDFIRQQDLDEPSLVEMTERAIKILEQNPNGYFLLVEGGRIDHAHHDSMAKMSLYDFVAFDEAIGKAVSITSKEDTIITVTADHSHVFSLGGYSDRGNPIFGLTTEKEKKVLDQRNLTFSTLLYANGPGFYSLEKLRDVNLTEEVTSGQSYKQESAIPLSQETHGGEDVAVYSRGPMSFLFDGTVEQNYITHVMAYSTCIGPYDTQVCRTGRPNVSNDSAGLSKNNLLVQTLLLVSLALFLLF